MRRRSLFLASAVACLFLSACTGSTTHHAVQATAPAAKPSAGPAGVTAATYRPCAHVAGFYAQGFAFTGGQIRGCVPLEVTAAGQPRVRRVTLSLFAGSCPG